jgi:starch-binding outer membrane protein, SusD/RagB family
MKFNKLKSNIFVACIILAGIVIVTSCKKYVEIPVGKGLLTNTQVYSTDSSATGATLALYTGNTNTSAVQNMSWLGGLSSDELQYTAGSDAGLIEFSKDAVSRTNTDNTSFWGYPYTLIYYANQNIAGINASTTLSTATKNQLLGENKFMRAFNFFYLVNYYGAVPLTLDPLPLNNAKLPRASTTAVYAQIVQDLKDAISEMSADYPGSSSYRIRPNKWAATALLARVDLYLKDYNDAATLSAQVINSGTYSLESLDNVFLNTSNEAILQFATPQGYSTIASDYLTDPMGNDVPPATMCLYSNFMSSFEAGDNRASSWVTSTTYNGVTYNEIYKWKLATAEDGNEYNMILRLAEMYLIKAECEAENNQITAAQADLNMIRNRAGLGNTTAATTAQLLTAILAERKVELFGEFAHRWFDLKRTGTAETVLKPLKPAFTSTSLLYPIPYSEILLNPNLTQNPGY